MNPKGVKGSREKRLKQQLIEKFSWEWQQILEPTNGKNSKKNTEGLSEAVTAVNEDLQSTISDETETYDRTPQGTKIIFSNWKKQKWYVSRLFQQFVIYLRIKPANLVWQ